MARSKGTGSVTKLSNGSYRARIKLNYKPVSKCFKTLREANAWLAEIQRDGLPAKPSSIRLSEWWDTWIEAYKLRSVSPATLNSYADSKKRLEILMSKSISSITTADVQKALNSISDNGSKRRTVEISRTALNMCMNRAVKDKMIPHNPVTGTTLPKQDAVAGVPLSEDEEKLFVSLCRKPQQRYSIWVIRQCLLFILRTGVRPSEGAKIEWTDIKADKIHIRGTKTDGSNRWLPLTPEIKSILEGMKPKRSKYVFATSTGTFIGKDNLTRHMQAIIGHTTKDLRHTFATRAAQAGVNPKVLMTILGHSTIETTLKYYTHVEADDQLLAMQAIAAKCQTGDNPPKITNII